MTLIRLKLENFRQYRSAEIEFRDGLTAIVGANGSGKTTLLEAITFTLYGEMRDKKESLLCLWVDMSEKIRCAATLEFIFDGRRLRIERAMTGKNLTAKATLEEKVGDEWTVRAIGADAVKTEVFQLIGLTREQFRNSFCAEQKALSFLNFPVASRQKEVARMLGLDRLRLAAETAKAKEKLNVGIAGALKDQLGDLDDLNRQVSEAQTALKEIRDEEARVGIERAELEIKLPAAQAGADRAKAWQSYQEDLGAKRQSGTLLKERKALEAKDVEAAKARVAKRTELEPNAKRWAELNAENQSHERNAAVTREFAAKRGQLEGERAGRSELQDRLALTPAQDVEAAKAAVADVLLAVQQAKAAYQTAEREWNKDKSDAASSVSVAEAELRSADTALNKALASEKSGDCPECGQPTSGDQFAAILGERKRAAEAARAEVERQKARKLEAEKEPETLAKAQATVAEAEGKHSLAQSAHEAVRLADQSRQELVRQISDKDALIQKLDAELQQAPAQYDEAAHKACREALKALEPDHHAYLALADAGAQLAMAQSRLAQTELDWDKALEEANALKAKIAETGVADAAAAYALTEKYAQIKVKIGELDGRLKGFAETIPAREDALAKAVLRVDAHLEQRRKYEDALAVASLNKVVSDEMQALRNTLNKRIVPELEARASENLGLLTNSRYTYLRLSENFEPTVEQDGMKKPVISGGEEDVVALALRLALAELIQEMNGRPLALLMLDEVFGSLDGERRQLVLERLQGLKSKFQQVLMISHIEDINQVADQCIFVTVDPNAKTSSLSDIAPGAQDLSELEAV